ERPAPMSLEDRLFIQDVIARYSYSYGGRDADGFAQLFVEDASFEVIVPTQSRPAVRVLSRAASRKWAVQRRELTAGIQTRHYQSELLFDELTVNTARATAGAGRSQPFDQAFDGLLLRLDMGVPRRRADEGR